MLQYVSTLLLFFFVLKATSIYLTALTFQIYIEKHNRINYNALIKINTGHVLHMCRKHFKLTVYPLAIFSILTVLYKPSFT